MTVVNHDARNQYIATNGQTIFNYTFEIAANTDIKVYQRADNSTPDDVADLLVLTTDYSVTGVGGENGGTIVLVSGAALDDIITIQGNAPPERDTAFTPSGVIQAQNLNLEFDNDILIYQTILAVLNNLVPKYPQSAIVDDFELILPNLAENEVWQMNDSRTAIIASVMVSGADFASHAAGLGASLIGLHPVGTVQDLANASFILQTANPAAPNGQSLGALGSGVLKSATGSGVVSISAALTSLDLVSSAADMIPYYTGVNTFGATGFTAFGRSLVDDVDATAGRVTLGVIIGTNVQAYNANLQSISALGTAMNKMLYTTGVNVWAEADITSFSRSLLADTTAASWRATLGVPSNAEALLVANNLNDVANKSTSRTNLGVAIGTDVQAWDATLQSLSSLGTTADKIAYTTGVDTWAEATLTSYMRTLLDDGNAAQAAVTLAVLPLAGGTMTGNLILNGDPTTGSQAATKSYVDSVTQSNQIACLCLTPTDMPTWTYNNGALGVGATLTAPINGATTFDGTVPVDTNRVLVLFQTTNPAWQGPYTIVQGTAGTPTVLTRATDWDTAAEMQPGDTFSVVTGTTYGPSQWVFSQVNPVTVGTTALTFSQLTGQGALLRANNLSDLPSVVTARINLGLVIGTNVQAYDATLQSISSLGTAADRIIYTTGVDTWAESGITTLGRSLINGANTAAMQTTLGLVIGTNVQAYDATLQSISALGTAADKMIYTTGIDTWAEAAITSFGRSLVAAADATAGRVVMGVVIGTNVQAYDATLQSISALGTAADKMIYTTGVDTWAESAITSFGRTFVALADASAARTNLGLVIGTNVQAYDATLQSLSALGTAADKMAYTTGVDTWAETAITATGRSIVAAANGAAVLTAIGGAASGANADITSLIGLTGVIRAPTSISSAASVKLLEFSYIASAVNYVSVQNNTTGSNPAIFASGTDGNITLQIQGKGTGGVYLVGVSSGASAVTGQVGEYLNSQVTNASSVTLTNATATNITTLSLTAGDWNVWANFNISVSNTTMTTGIGWISTTSATAPDQSLYNGFFFGSAAAISTGWGDETPMKVVSVSGTTTVYLSCLTVGTGGTAKICGQLHARRIR